MKITYYAAISSDGYIAKKDGDVSWLDELNIDMTDTGYNAFFAGIDGLVMGRDTYDFIFRHGSWPYGEKPTWVFTSSPLKTLEGANLKIITSTEDLIQEAESKGVNHLWMVGGGRIASLFLEKGLLTHLIISKMPIKLGSGIPLFADHTIENLAVKSTEIYQKKGFKQIEIALPDSYNT